MRTISPRGISTHNSRIVRLFTMRSTLSEASVGFLLYELFAENSQRDDIKIVSLNQLDM